MACTFQLLLPVIDPSRGAEGLSCCTESGRPGSSRCFFPSSSMLIIYTEGRERHVLTSKHNKVQICSRLQLLQTDHCLVDQQQSCHTSACSSRPSQTFFSCTHTTLKAAMRFPGAITKLSSDGVSEPVSPRIPCRHKLRNLCTNCGYPLNAGSTG